MTAWRYQISLKERFLISTWPCNKLYLLTKFEVKTVSYGLSFFAQIYELARCKSMWAINPCRKEKTVLFHFWVQIAG